MLGFYILLLAIFAGFGVIVWIIITEKKKEAPAEDKPTGEPQLSPGDVLGRLGLETPKAPGASPTVITPKIPLPPIFNKPDPIAIAKPSLPPVTEHTPSPGPTISKSESELSLKYDELLTEHKELQAKYEKLDQLFNEKSNGLEQTEKNLLNELKNQKEFNKVKDILEKELKDTKDKNRVSQSETAAAKTEIDNNLKKITQLEEKVKKLEVSALSAEAALNDANSDTQLARKKIVELEEKLRETETHILEKNQKIEGLVIKLKDVFPGNTLPSPQPPEIQESPAPPEPILTPILPPPPAMNSDEKGGAEISVPKVENMPPKDREEAQSDIAEKPAEIAEKTAEEEPPAKEKPLALPPDIFADKPASAPENPVPPPEQKAP